MSDYYSQSNIDTSALVRVFYTALKASVWKILIVAVLAGILTFLYTKTTEPEYEAVAVMYIAPKQTAVFDVRELMMQRRDPAYQQTQLGIILSRSLIEQVVMELALETDPAFMETKLSILGGLEKSIKQLFAKGSADKAKRASDLRVATEKLKSLLLVQSQKNSYLVEILATMTDPDMAAKVANSLANAYVELNYANERGNAARSEEWLLSRLQGVRQDLQRAEADLQKFKEQEKIMGGSSFSDGLATQEMDLIGAQLIQSREKRLNLESLYQQIIKTERAGGDLQGIAAVQSNEVIRGVRQEVIQLEKRKGEMSKRYGPEHRKMIALNSEIQSTQDSLGIQLNRIISAVKADYELAKESETYFQGELSLSTGKFQSLGRKQFELRDYEQKVKTQREIYKAFLDRLNKSKATGDGINTNVRLTDPALPPLSAKSNKSKIIVFLMMFFAGGFVFFIAVLIEFFDNSILNSNDVETKLAESSLAIVPAITELEATEDRPDVAYHYYLINKYSMYAESIRTMRSSLMLSALNSTKQRYLFTSTVPSEGKTSLAVSSAVAFGQVRKTLLIDGDLRKPSIQKIFAEHSDRRYLGLSDLCIGTTDTAQCIHHSEELGIDILPAGTITPNPQELFCSTSFSQLLNDLSDIYDVIVIDSPPAGGLSDAALLASYVDQVIYVVRAGETPVVKIRASIKRLKQTDAPIKGIVLNRVSPDQSQSSYYYYNSYGREQAEAEAETS